METSEERQWTDVHFRRMPPGGQEADGGWLTHKVREEIQSLRSSRGAQL